MLKKLLHEVKSYEPDAVIAVIGSTSDPVHGRSSISLRVLRCLSINHRRESYESHQYTYRATCDYIDREREA